MAAGKPAAYEVTGAAAVVRNGKNERYVYRGDSFGADTIDATNAAHLVGIGLIRGIEATEAEEPYKGVSVADLKAEIAKRNEGRADDAKIVPAEPGNRPEVVAALVADDEKLAAA
ncbi:hypothetical protein ACIGCK_04805 [Microbacterium sp. NPDC078428]|uniref:hypothetical protein n=1 Tax=Microbacterium sp. NPDC078428 TaxID=3364190 RepID=UPI0037CBA612